MTGWVLGKPGCSNVVPLLSQRTPALCLFSLCGAKPSPSAFDSPHVASLWSLCSFYLRPEKQWQEAKGGRSCAEAPDVLSRYGHCGVYLMGTLQGEPQAAELCSAVLRYMRRGLFPPSRYWSGTAGP